LPVPGEVEDIPCFGFGLFRKGESWNRQFQPAAADRSRSSRRQFLPGTGRDAAFRLADKLTSAGFAVTDSVGQLAGHVAHFDERLVAAPSFKLLRKPQNL
jgi:hypothetical protein